MIFYILSSLFAGAFSAHIGLPWFTSLGIFVPGIIAGIYIGAKNG